MAGLGLSSTVASSEGGKPGMKSLEPNAPEGGGRLQWERELWSAGQPWVAGVDEAGRGPLAGPVVAAAVMLPSEWGIAGVPEEYAGLNDSKKLTERARERFHARLTTDGRIRFAIAEAGPGRIDEVNILMATHEAMNEALARLIPAPMHVLVDGLRVASMRFPQTPLVGGDGRSYSIAAASVLAKVTRDRLMLEADRRFPGYGFARHKGYPTAEHLEALRRRGPCELHRRSFGGGMERQPGLFG